MNLSLIQIYHTCNKEVKLLFQGLFWVIKSVNGDVESLKLLSTHPFTADRLRTTEEMVKGKGKSGKDVELRREREVIENELNEKAGRFLRPALFWRILHWLDSLPSRRITKINYRIGYRIIVPFAKGMIFLCY